MIFALVGLAVGIFYVIFRRKILIGAAVLSIYKVIEHWDFWAAAAARTGAYIIRDGGWLAVQEVVVLALMGLAVIYGCIKINLWQRIKDDW